ncbi:MAG: hypothetical protein WD512_06420 [Candidatus Paceibacterota bacterium]
MSKYKSLKKNFREDALMLADAIYNLKLKYNKEYSKDDTNKENEAPLNEITGLNNNEEVVLDLVANFLRKHNRIPIHLREKKRFNTLI